MIVYWLMMCGGGAVLFVVAFIARKRQEQYPSSPVALAAIMTVVGVLFAIWAYPMMGR